jgi:hypothetical protein
MIASLSVDQNHCLSWDSSAVPYNFGDCFSGETHGADGVVTGSLLDDGIQVRHFLFLVAVCPCIFDVWIVLLDILIGLFLELLSFRC